MINRILIVGTGLIGSSTGLALRAAGFSGHITGAGPTEATLTTALQMGAIDHFLPPAELTHAHPPVAREADLILLAGPVLSILDWMHPVSYTHLDVYKRQAPHRHDRRGSRRISRRHARP